MKEDFASVLLRWYAAHGRELPWRNTRDPYLIWISEIILQQTRVAQGYDYFLRFIKRFPDVNSLAAASEDDVLKAWQGLGYYSRARNLHAAAQSMRGVFPSSYQGVRALKGVGDYTAAAICSFAYRMPYAVLDGNVYRVLARIFGYTAPTDTSAAKKYFSALAQKLLDKTRPDDYNQAIMDFGAVQCVPVSPDCSVCPFAKRCKAFQKDWVDRIPARTAKAAAPERFFNYIYVKQGPYTWLEKRTGADIWRGLYQLPLLEASAPLTQTELENTDFWRTRLGVARANKRGPSVKHVLTHRVIYADFYEVSLPPSHACPPPYLKIPLADLPRYAVPRLVHRFLEKYVWVK